MLGMTTRKPGQWETVKSKADDKKKKDADNKKKGGAVDRLGVAVDPSSAAFAAFDRSFAASKAAEAAAAAKEKKAYKGGFADLEDEAPPAPAAADSGDDEPAGSSNSAAAGGGGQKKQPKAPKAPKKPKLSIAQVAAGLDVAGLQGWMAEIQQRYSANETAQLQAVSDRLLGAFKEATFDLGKLIGTKGLEAASQQPIAELPNPLLNALASFVASVSEPALVQVLVPLVNAVVAEGSGAGTNQGPAGKGKAGLFVMVAVLLRTRPQALVQAAGDLRLAGRQLTGPGKLPVLLWVINQAAKAEPAVGVAVWVRLLLPQVLGLIELPSSAAGGSSKASKAGAAAIAGGDQAQLLVPLDVPSQKVALDYLAGLLRTLGVGAGGAASAGGDITRGDGALQPTVPGAAVELLSRLIAGAAWAPAAATAGGAGAAAGAAAAESKKAAAARAAAAEGLAPLLPGLTALAAVSSCGRQYSDWLVLALESAALSGSAPDRPDQLVLRSASNVVACLCGNDSCFALWEGKHKGGLRGSARVLAALVQQPQLLGPLLQQRTSLEAFRGLLASLPARHRSHLAAGKGWQGSCARVAEDACAKLPRKLGRCGWGKGSKGAAGGSGGVGPVMAVLGLGSLTAGVLVMAGLYRREVAGVVAAYAGRDAAQQLEQQVLLPLEAGVQQGLLIAGPYLEQLQEAAGPSVAAAWDKVGPVVGQLQEQAAPAVAALQQLYATAAQQLQEIAAKAKQA